MEIPAEKKTIDKANVSKEISDKRSACAAVVDKDEFPSFDGNYKQKIRQPLASACAAASGYERKIQFSSSYTKPSNRHIPSYPEEPEHTLPLNVKDIKVGVPKKQEIRLPALLWLQNKTPTQGWHRAAMQMSEWFANLNEENVTKQKFK